MTITITPNSQVVDDQARTVKSYTQATGTALQTLDPNYDVHNLGMGTATGFGVNRYLLATDGDYEGRVQYIQATATGAAHLVLTGTATGAWVLAAATDIMRFRQFNGAWNLEQNSGATLATATGTA